MRFKYSARLAVCAAIAGSAGFAVAVPGGVASAGALKVACSNWSGTVTIVGGSPVTSGTVSGCTGTGVGVTGTHGTFSGKSFVWASGATSTTGTITNTAVAKDKCVGTNLGEQTITGVMASGALAGSKIKGSICAYSSGGTIHVVNFKKAVKF
jgi:hypothetical protein